MPAHKAETDIDLAYCAELVRRADRTRWLCALLAAPAARPSLLALYAFNAELGLIRESVRDPLLGRIRLQWWHDRLADLPRQPAAHPVLRALARHAPAAGWDIQALQRNVAARQSDMELVPFATFADLFDYAEATATDLIGQGVAALGGRRAAGHRQAGIVVTLAGLLTGLPALLAMGRVPLPRDGLTVLGIDPACLHQVPAWQGITPLVGELVDAAKRNIRQVAGVDRRVWPAYAPVRVARWRLRRLRQVACRADRLPPESPLALLALLAKGRLINRL